MKRNLGTFAYTAAAIAAGYLLAGASMSTLMAVVVILILAAFFTYFGDWIDVTDDVDKAFPDDDSERAQ
jgi:cell division protein FtsW (lipid II flippase)